MKDIKVCPICGRPAHVASDDTRAAAYNVECKVCGRYLAGMTFMLGVNQRTERPADALLARYLSGYTRTVDGSVQISGDNWREPAQKHKDTPPEEKTRKLLKYLQGKSAFMGAKVDVPDDDYPLFDSGSIEEKDALISQAVADEYVSGGHPLFSLTRGGKDFLADRPVERRIFLSHATDDAGIAEVLANAIRERLAGTGVEMFVSSQSGNIPTGNKWLDVVETKLITGTTYLVLITSRSVVRPWLWFETGSFWFKGRQIIVLCADGYSKGDVPYPLGSIQVLSLDVRADIVTLFEKDLRTTPGDVDALIAALKARSMAGQAHVSFAGSEWIWSGALGALEDRQAAAPAPGLKEEFEQRGFRWRCGDPEKEGHWSQKGLFPLYQADPHKWKRKLRCPDNEKQIIYVKAPPLTGIDGLKELLTEQSEEIQTLKRGMPDPKEKPSGIKWGCYQFKGMEGLYCTACWDSRGAKSLTNRTNANFRTCPVCRAVIGT